MGLFSTKRKTYVSSTVYNLAGDENLRPKVLNSFIIGAVLSGNQSIAQAITTAQFTGSGMRQKRFFRWAQDNYPHALPTALVDGTQNLDTAAVLSGLSTLIPLAPEETLRVSKAAIDFADVDYWAEEHVRLNYPELTLEDWTADYDKLTSEIVIQYDEVTEDRFPAPADFLWGISGTVLKRLLFVSYTIVTEDPIDGTISETLPTLFVYRLGTGNVALDALEMSAESLSEFYPALPLRIDNESLADSPYADIEEDVKKAFKKLTGSDYAELVASIEDNESIDDIDFAFLVQGVSLNAKDTQAKKYIYEFFLALMAAQRFDKNNINAYYSAETESISSGTFWESIITTRVENDPYNPGVSAPLPSILQIFTAGLPETQVRITSEDMPEFDFRIRWSCITETQHMGNASHFDGDTSREPLKKGEYWFCGADDLRTTERLPPVLPDDGMQWFERAYNRVFLFSQYDTYSYSCLELLGMKHENHVYNDKAVTITAKEAIEDEEESGFLLPLHYPTLSKFGLVSLNQLSTSTMHIVFNCYKIVKVRWYQRGIFRIVLVIGAVALAAFTGGTSLGATAGVLGTNAAVGAALGMAAGTLTAAIVGAIANAVAAMIVTQIITTTANKIFGGKLGAIIGTIASFVALTYGNHHALTGNWNVSWGTIMRAENLLSLTNAVTDAYVGWLNADTAEIYERMGRLDEEYQDQLKEIQELSESVLGMTGIQIDPTMLTEAAAHFEESSESFLSRTLLTGSDIAELSFNMIESYADITTNLDLRLI